MFFLFSLLQLLWFTNYALQIFFLDSVDCALTKKNFNTPRINEYTIKDLRKIAKLCKHKTSKLDHGNARVNSQRQFCFVLQRDCNAKVCSFFQFKRIADTCYESFLPLATQATLDSKGQQGLALLAEAQVHVP